MRDITKAIELIKRFEGLSLKAYKCPAGVLTIGYGHTAGVRSGDTITEELAEELLKLDLKPILSMLDSYDPEYHFTNNEYNALISFMYNLGVNILNTLTNHGARTKEEFSQKIPLYCYANGKKLEGLVKRRYEEYKLFITPDEGYFLDQYIYPFKKED